MLLQVGLVQAAGAACVAQECLEDYQLLNFLLFKVVVQDLDHVEDLASQVDQFLIEFPLDDFDFLHVSVAAGLVVQRK